MATSQPPLLYLQEVTNAVLHQTQDWRQSGLMVCYSVDAGPNVHLLTPSASADAVHARLREFPGVREVLRSGPGGPARVVSAGAD
jgi:diphosphomevalonate decarboxylase